MHLCVCVFKISGNMKKNLETVGGDIEGKLYFIFPFSAKYSERFMYNVNIKQNIRMRYSYNLNLIVFQSCLKHVQGI